MDYENLIIQTTAETNGSDEVNALETFFSSYSGRLPASFVIPATGALPLRAWTRRVGAVECRHHSPSSSVDL